MSHIITDTDGREKSYYVTRSGGYLTGDCRRILAWSPDTRGIRVGDQRTSIMHALRRAENDVAFYTDALRYYDREIADHEAKQVAEMKARAKSDADAVGEFFKTLAKAMKTATTVMNSDTVSPELVTEAKRRQGELVKALNSTLGAV